MLTTQELALSGKIYELEQMHLVTGNRTPSSATVILRKNGRVFQDSVFGQGAIDACFKAVNSILQLEPTLEKFEIKSSGKGVNGPDEATATVRHGDQVFIGRGFSEDVVEASLKAYLDACNQHLLFINSYSQHKSSREKSESSYCCSSSLAW
jgi:2-isopropylmalate synthase